MKRTIAAALAASAILATGFAHADYLYRGKVIKWTADRLIIELKLTCKPVGQWRSETLANGSTVLTRSKVCSSERLPNEAQHQ